MTSIVKRLRQVQGDKDDAQEAATKIERLCEENIMVATKLLESEAKIERLRTDYSILKSDYDALRAENERLKAEVADRDRIINMSD